MKPLDAMLHWVNERENVRIKKEAGKPYPWTKDKIISEHRFCNVRREDDLVTRWVHANIRIPFRDHPNLWFMLCIARQINWPDTLAEMIKNDSSWPRNGNFSPKLMGNALQARNDRGEKVFTGAYNITAPPTKGAKKTHFVAEHTLGNLWEERAGIGGLWHDYGQRDGGHIAVQPSMKRIHTALMRFDCWGPFMAYQAVVDMRFTPLLQNAKDVSSWAAAGPGTLRGLNRINGRSLDKKISQDQALSEMRYLWPVLLATGVEMDLSDVPNVLCESDKYMRLMNGEGQVKAKYVPGRGA